MRKPEFVYTIYIQTTPDKLWHALTDREFTLSYWFGCSLTFGLEGRLSHADAQERQGGERMRHPGVRSAAPTGL